MGAHDESAIQPAATFGLADLQTAKKMPAAQGRSGQKTRNGPDLLLGRKNLRRVHLRARGCVLVDHA
jgi:hypothetical protein